MKVAIIGAGLSGLACAHELIKSGIRPTIFDKKGSVYELYEFPTINLRLFDIPVKKPLQLLENEYKIKLVPNYRLDELLLVSDRKTYSFKGNLGSIYIRGQYDASIEKQLFSTLDFQVNFNTEVKLSEIYDEFDYIVVSTGTTQIAQENNLYSQFFGPLVRIAKVKGSFKTNLVKVWFNKDLCKNGFAYFSAFNAHEGRLVLIADVTDYNELNLLWSKFIEHENIQYEITDSVDMKHSVGCVKPSYFGKIYLTGNAGGFVDSIFGFGAANALLTGAIAGRCIARGLNYNKNVKIFRESILNLHEYRKAYNVLKNKQIDMALATLNMPIVRQFVYNNPFMRANYGVPFVKLFNRFKYKS